ncbi:MAG: hypothetical protein Q7K42_04510 [Candidatus Diapherotrites archaeon]|nr:hypothetical protein [Candidatus Diapherotrites archaeon]
MGVIGFLIGTVKFLLLSLLIILFSISTSVALYSYNLQPLLNENSYIEAMNTYKVFDDMHELAFMTLDETVKETGFAIPKTIKTELQKDFSPIWIKTEIKNLLGNFLGYMRGDKARLKIVIKLPQGINETLNPEKIIISAAKDKIEEIKKQNPELEKTISEQIAKLQCMPEGFTKTDIQPYFPELAIPDNLRECTEAEAEQMLGSIFEKVDITTLVSPEDLKTVETIAPGITEEAKNTIESDLECIPEGFTKKDLEDALGITIDKEIPACASAAPSEEQKIANFQTKTRNVNLQTDTETADALNELFSLEFPTEIDIGSELTDEFKAQMAEIKDYSLIFLDMPLMLGILSLILLGLIVLLNILHPVSAVRWVGTAIASAGISTLIPSGIVHFYLPSFISEQVGNFSTEGVQGLGIKIMNSLVDLVYNLNYNVLFQSGILLAFGIFIIVISIVLGFFWKNITAKIFKKKPQTEAEKKSGPTESEK